MTQKKFHILITGEEGDVRSLVIKKKSIFNSLCLTAVLLAFMLIGTGQGFKYFKLRIQTNALIAELAETTSTLENLSNEKIEIVSRYEKDIYQLKEKQESLLEGSISRLDERSRVIKSVMDHIGVEVKIEEDPNHSGGPFIELDDTYFNKLIYQTDRYLEVLNKIPLGRPVPDSISSKYGYRLDPIKKKKTKAFHSGVDFRGRTGDKVISTADGVAKIVTRSKGRGNYITISHGNGYDTHFAHLSKHLVKKGEKIKRGQVIGLVGNTGRSTGSHLHYEVRYRGKTINPMKYLQVANLSVSVDK